MPIKFELLFGIGVEKKYMIWNSYIKLLFKMLLLDILFGGLFGFYCLLLIISFYLPFCTEISYEQEKVRGLLFKRGGGHFNASSLLETPNIWDVFFLF